MKDNFEVVDKRMTFFATKKKLLFVFQLCSGIKNARCKNIL